MNKSVKIEKRKELLKFLFGWYCYTMSSIFSRRPKLINGYLHSIRELKERDGKVKFQKISNENNLEK
jgi:hypothetical protein